LKKSEFPVHVFDHIFLAAPAMQEDNNEIDGILRCYPQQHVRMFLVIPPLLDTAHEGSHSQAAAGPEEADDTVPKTGPALTALEKKGTTNIDGDQTALLLATGKSQSRMSSHDCAPGIAQAVGMLEVEDALLHANGEVAMEEASYVAIVSDDRNAFVHRSKLLLEHLVKVRVCLVQLNVQKQKYSTH
jgi:hypothetical protein